MRKIIRQVAGNRTALADKLDIRQVAGNRTAVADKLDNFRLLPGAYFQLNRILRGNEEIIFLFNVEFVV